MGIYPYSADEKLICFPDDLLNVGNDYFDGLISQIYPSELHLNKAHFFEYL